MDSDRYMKHFLEPPEENMEQILDQRTVGLSRIDHSLVESCCRSSTDWIHFIPNRQYLEELVINHKLELLVNMQYADDIELWNMDLDSSPFATLTADFADFKKKFQKIFNGNKLELSPGSSSESGAGGRNLGYEVKSGGLNINRISNGSSAFKPIQKHLDAEQSHRIDNQHANIPQPVQSGPKSAAKRPNQLPVRPVVDTRTTMTVAEDRLSSRMTCNQGGDRTHESKESGLPPQRPKRKCDTDRKKTQSCKASTPYYHGDTSISVKQCFQGSLDSHKANSATSVLNDVTIGATHRGTHRFVRRHDDELAIEIGDSIHVLQEDEDGWCQGINLNTSKQGIFPSVYATDLSFYETEAELEPKPQTVAQIFQLHYLGSMEVNHYKGTDVLMDAIERVVKGRQSSKDPTPPPLCHLEVNPAGIKMIDVTHKKRSKKFYNEISEDRPCERLRKLIAFSKETKAVSNHFFSLRNISFCGYHPEHPRYFGFITKHPTQARYACHCYASLEKTSQAIVDSVGQAFQSYYYQQEDMCLSKFTIPEDIYLE